MIYIELYVIVLSARLAISDVPYSVASVTFLIISYDGNACYKV